MQPLSGNQRPDLLTSLMEHVSCIASATENASLQIFADLLQMSHACRRHLEMLQNPHVLLTFGKVHNPLRLPQETTSERQKVVRACDRNFQKWSGAGVFCTF